jgi:aspartate-semialdehyde dehydrogenase
MGMRVAVVGATGAVGRRMIRILEERTFPVDELLPLASQRSAGTVVAFRDQSHTVRELTHDAFDGVDLALVSAGATVSREFLPGAAAGGTVCIDNSSAFRMEAGVPLCIPEVNPESLEGDPKIIAVPNCTTITAMLPIGPLHRAAGLRALVISSYQSVSGAGWKGVVELEEQVGVLHGHEEELGHPDEMNVALPTGDVFGKTIAFNVVAKIGTFEEDGYTGEESKMMAEPRKILEAPDLFVAATAIRVPTTFAHAVSMYAEFDRPITPDEARDILRGAPGVVLQDDPAAGIYPSPIEAAGHDEAFVGRIRQAEGRDDALLLFSCADNLRKGAALNAVQIAEAVFQV